MSIEVKEASAGDLRSRRDDILAKVGRNWNELVERRERGELTAEEWAAWDELLGIVFLLDEQ